MHGQVGGGDDGLPAEDVGAWVEQKHERLRKYIQISAGARNRFLHGRSKSATFIDLFCGPGRACVRDTGQWVDGSSVAAWKVSLESGAPFSAVYVADIDEERRLATVERLRRLNAPVFELDGDALVAARTYASIINPYGLHFAFIDPFNLEALDFGIVKSLAGLRRIDMLIHISKMDHQRNLDVNIGADEDMSPYDKFVPGWRANVDQNCSAQQLRVRLVEYWVKLVEETGKQPSADWDLIRGSRNQHLYWLLLVAQNELAHKFWHVTTEEKQLALFC